MMLSSTRQMLGSVNMVLYIWVVPMFEVKNKIGRIITILREREREKYGNKLVHGHAINF